MNAADRHDKAKAIIATYRVRSVEALKEFPDHPNAGDALFLIDYLTELQSWDVVEKTTAELRRALASNRQLTRLVEGLRERIDEAVCDEKRDGESLDRMRSERDQARHDADVHRQRADDQTHACQETAKQLNTARAHLESSRARVVELMRERDELKMQLHEDAFASDMRVREELAACRGALASTQVELGEARARGADNADDVMRLANDKAECLLTLQRHRDIYRDQRDDALSDLAEARAKLAEYERTLGECVKAMDLWGAQEDGVPESGPDELGSIGSAYDNAKMLLGWAHTSNRATREQPADGESHE